MSKMRAKLVVQSVTKHQSGETLKFAAVCRKDAYPADGSDENNTFAKFTPSASCEMFVANPELHGQFQPGDEYYVDFIKAG
jgi:hypothetical protein